MWDCQYTPKENKQGRCESNEKRRGDVCKPASREREREGEVISGDLRPQRCIELCTADRSVMDFRMC